MALNELREKTVNVITTDGRNIVGTLKGFDQVQNIVLSNSHERIFSDSAGVLQQPLGLYIIRGDTMYVSCICLINSFYIFIYIIHTHLLL